MSAPLPMIYLARHGETAWTITRQHTGLSDIPLTERGERNAVRLGERLAGLTFAKVYTSPLIRATRTCELAGFGKVAEADRDLVEWNYGDYDGKTTAEIRDRREKWDLFRDGCPRGESLGDVVARVDRLITKFRGISGGDVLAFSSGHLLRVLAARWCKLDGSTGKLFFLGTASLCTLGYEHTTSEPVIRLWNDSRHVGD